MTRIAFTMHLLKGYEEEYKRRHDEIWPELEELLRGAGVKDYNIYLDEPTGTLFASMEIEDEKKLDALPDQPVMKRWWKFMSDIMQTNPDNSPVTSPLKNVFFLP